MRRILRLERFALPFQPGSIVLSILVPGFVFRVYDLGLVSNLAMAGYALALLSFFIWLGYFAAAACFTFMLSLHLISILFLIRRLAPDLGIQFRVFAAFVLLGGLNVFGYLQARSLLSNVIFPLKRPEGVVVVNTLSSSRDVRRGDWISYKVEAHSGAGFRVEEGYGIARVLGVSGDRITFSPNNMTINGTTHSREATMSRTGEWVVPENNWFIWPTFAINRWGPMEAQTAEGFRSNAFLTKSQFFGKPFKRWFGRRQL